MLTPFTNGGLVKLANFFVLVFGLLISSYSFALNNGIVYELGGGAGYILQADKIHFKALGKIYHDGDHDYNDTVSLRLAVGVDVAEFDQLKLYVGGGLWNDFVSADHKLYETRYDALVGLRQVVASHWQFEIFVNAISLASGQTVNTTVDGVEYTRKGASGLYLTSSGAVSVAYLF
jgi:hypothetical protein